MHRKFGEIRSGQTNRQTDRHTDTLIASVCAKRSSAETVAEVTNRQQKTDFVSSTPTAAPGEMFRQWARSAGLDFGDWSVGRIGPARSVSTAVATAHIKPAV